MTHPSSRDPAPSPTHPRVVIRSAGALVVAFALLLVGGGVVNAATRVFSDPNDSPTIDIRKVHVSYRDWLRIRVEHDGRIAVGQVYAFWIDTRPRNPGPEYYDAFRPNAEVPQLERVSGFGDRTRTPVRCQKRNATANVGTPHADITFHVAGSCLGDPKRVRVSVHFVNADRSSADWAPAARRLYTWVHRD